MNQYFLELKLDEHPLENFYQYPDHLSKKTKSAYTYAAVHKGFIKSGILKIFQNSGLEFGGAVIFRKKPNQTIIFDATASIPYHYYTFPQAQRAAKTFIFQAQICYLRGRLRP
jgi:hypothetical protein